MNPKRPTPRHTVIKMSKLKTKNLKNCERKITCYEQRTSGQWTINVRSSPDSSTETLQAKREWYDILRVLKRRRGKKKTQLPTKTLYTPRLSFRIKKRDKDFSRQAKAKGDNHH